MFRKKSASTPRESFDGNPPTPPKTNKNNNGSSRNKLTQIQESINRPKEKQHIDDFGVINRPQAAYSGNSREKFGKQHGYGIGEDEFESENQLLYGYCPVSTELQLKIEDVLGIVARVSKELKTRGLNTPLILSSLALDLKAEGVINLIRSYLNSSHQEWLYDLSLASPLDIGSFLKWGLARIVNEKDGRGFITLEQYSEFKVGERNAKYPPKYIATHLIPRLPANNGALLSMLLSLFSSIAGYSIMNGMPPRKIAALFSGYFFGLMDDGTFDETYAQWDQITQATEHLLLAFIRDQKATSGQIPTHLENFISTYPPASNSKISAGIRMEEVTRVRRLARFHSNNLIQSAGTWTVPESNDWDLFFPPKNLAASTSSTPPLPIFTPHYKHLLNIRANSNLQYDDDDGAMQRFKSVVERDWGKFGELGFQSLEIEKLQFDLSEGERKKIRDKHSTMDWSTFSSSGFGGRETFAPADLIFRQNISETVKAAPATQAAISDRLRATEKMLPAFSYDTTPHEEGRIKIASDFLEAWSDILVSSGWAFAELKASSFALVQWKSRPRAGEIAKGRATVEGDLRTEDRTVLVEEFVPQEYLDELRAGKKKTSKRVSFLRVVRRKSIKSSPRPNVTQVTHPTMTSPSPRVVDNSVFNSGGGGNTRIISASNIDLAGRGSAYAPSSISSNGHGSPSSTPPLPNLPPSTSNIPPSSPSPSPRTKAYGIGESMSSQTRESAFGGRGPVGFNKPPTGAKGFLARMSSKNKKSNPPSPTSSPVISSPNSPLPATPTPPPAPPASRAPLQSNPATIINSSSVRAPVLSPTTPLPAIPVESMRITTRTPSPSRRVLKEDLNHTNTAVEKQGPTPPSKSLPTSKSSGRNSLDNYKDADEDPYGGLEAEEDEDESDIDIEEPEEGTVLFRGSRSFPRELNSQIVDSNIPKINVQAPSMKSSSSSYTIPSRRLPSAFNEVSGQANGRNGSLPPSPRPEGDFPIDEVADSPPTRYRSAASSVSRMVRNLENGRQ